MTFNDIMTQVARFTTEHNAQSYADREQGRWIVLGDNEYWVTSRRYAMKLVALGYQMRDE